MPSRFFKAALVLGLLSAISPFAIDMYLPALPAIGTGLRADVGTVQLSLMVFFVSMGVGQLVYGPLSDMFGRKPPIYGSARRWPDTPRSCATGISSGSF